MDNGFHQRFNVPVRILELAQELKRGTKNLTEIKRQIDSDSRGILQYAESEDLKTVFHGCFMFALGRQFEDAKYQAVVCCMLAERLTDKNLIFGLEIGVGHVVICALYVQYCLLLFADSSEHSLQILNQMTQLLREEKDLKGYLEALSEMGLSQIRNQNYTDGIKALEEAIRLIEETSIPSDLLSESSNQEMVRATFQFSFPASITTLGDIDHIKWNLHLSAARALNIIKKFNSAVDHTSKALNMAEAKMSRQPPPELLLDLLHIHSMAMLGSGQIHKALDSALGLFEQAKKLGDLRHEGAGASIIALCYKTLGEENKAQQFLVKAQDVIQILEKKGV